MVGKIKRVREKLHQAAVKLDSPSSGGARSTDLEKAPIPSGSFIFDVNKTSNAQLHIKKDENAKVFYQHIIERSLANCVSFRWFS